MERASLRLGVEVGGTFTDLVYLDGNTLRVGKVPSTPGAPEQGALAAIHSTRVELQNVTEVAHGSTVATNAVLERKGALTAVVLTAGFRDLLHLQRNDRRNIYELYYQKASPLVRRRDCFEVVERVLATGEIAQPLQVEHIRRELLPKLRDGGYQAVAVCLLNAYANPQNEQMLASMLESELPMVSVACSSDITREYREYERASTTAVSAYVQPVLSRYLRAFEERLEKHGFGGTLGVMQSNGGRATVAAMQRNAATALYSGPAAGVIGATRQALRSGFKDLVTFDMGGTSTDVCLVKDAQPVMSVETEIDGLPIRTPVIDIVTVGAGGGSIVRLDAGHMLRVGPQSSAADPGPACYGRGGIQPTVTDAHLVRGTLQADMCFGNSVNLDLEAARQAFDQLARELDVSVETAADSAVRLATSNIVQAIHVVSTERGHDPRDYTLVAYGGAGPMHAVRVAESLGMRSVLVPPNAGVLSAYGLVASDWVHYETMTRKMLLDEHAPAGVARVAAELADRARSRLSESGVQGEAEISVALYMRFLGQAFELEVELGELRDDWSLAELRSGFDEVFERVFLHTASAERPVEMVSVRVGAVVPRSGVMSLPMSLGADSSSETVTVIEEGEQILDCPRRTRSELASGTRWSGPVLMTDDTSTVFVPAGWVASHDSQFNLLIEPEE